MPNYPYSCKDCGHAFEIVQSFSDDALTECPECGGNLRKVFSSVGVVFKGSGFYRNDSRNGGKSASGSTNAGATSSEGGSSSTTTSEGSSGASTGASSSGASAGSTGSGGSGGSNGSKGSASGGSAPSTASSTAS